VVVSIPPSPIIARKLAKGHFLPDETVKAPPRALRRTPHVRRQGSAFEGLV